MQNFDIIKKQKVEETFRVSKIMNDFDIKLEHSNEHFTGTIEYPENWQIGAIVGGSGTGKTTIIKELFKEAVEKEYIFDSQSVIDDMPRNININEITRIFYSVGFSSVPSWIKPYSVLSNGEKMRVNLARAILEEDFIVFDEFTSVVDRQIAKVISISLRKTMLKYPNKKIIVVSCHSDFLEYLQPDWIFDTNDMKQVFMLPHDLKCNLKLKDVQSVSGGNLGVITI